MKASACCFGSVSSLDFKADLKQNMSSVLQPGTGFIAGMNDQLGYHYQGPRSNFEIRGEGMTEYWGGHNTLFLTNSL